MIYTHKFIVNFSELHNINPLKTQLNSICYLLALLGAHHILHVSRISVKFALKLTLKSSYMFRCKTARRGSRSIALPFHDHGTRRGEGSASRPGRSLLPGKTRYPLYRRLGGLQGRSGLVRKISPPPGFDSRTVQPVASRYTDYATRPTCYKCHAPPPLQKKKVTLLTATVDCCFQFPAF
jgi:hypothetical protein